MIPHAFSLLEPCSNNVVEYQALIVELELALESGITMLEVLEDSQPDESEIWSQEAWYVALLQ